LLDQLKHPIVWQGDDCFTHMLVVGPTRCGKTSTILKPMIYQLLFLKKKGVPLGLSVVEPKGDVARLVKEICDAMEIPCTYIDPESPHSQKYNPMEGAIDDVAEATVVVLKGLFGKQEAFFATVQELSARNVTKLLKTLRGDKIDIIDVMNTLRDPLELERQVKELKRRDGLTDLVHFFETELLGTQKEKYRQFVIGLRAQLENITSNHFLRRIMTGKSDINMDEHFANGGVLAVNTSLGRLRQAGDAFGQFVIMHLQNATFRRPGTEKTRIPHFLIVDEYSRYINPDVEIFLSLAAEYRVAGVFATQSLGQLEVESGKIGAKAMKQSILTSCRNKIAFGGLSAADAKEFAEEFGKDIVIKRQKTYEHSLFIPHIFPKSFRDVEMEEYRYHFSQLMDGLKRFQFVYKGVKNGTPQPPVLGQGRFIPNDWKERRQWEEQKKTTFFMRVKKAVAELKPKYPRHWRWPDDEASEPYKIIDAEFTPIEETERPQVFNNPFATQTFGQTGEEKEAFWTFKPENGENQPDKKPSDSPDRFPFEGGDAQKKEEEAQQTTSTVPHSHPESHDGFWD